jgi:hypothetical protein
MTEELGENVNSERVQQVAYEVAKHVSEDVVNGALWMESGPGLLALAWAHNRGRADDFPIWSMELRVAHKDDAQT